MSVPAIRFALTLRRERAMKSLADVLLGAWDTASHMSLVVSTRDSRTVGKASVDFFERTRLGIFKAGIDCWALLGMVDVAFFGES